MKYGRIAICPLEQLPFQLTILHPMRLQILAKLFHHHFPVIRPVADEHLCNGLAFEGDDVDADSIVEPAVVCFRTV